MRLVFGAAWMGLCVAGACAQGSELLVVNQGDSDVSFVDAATARQVATVAEGTPGIHGHEIAVSADGRTAYLPIYGSSGVGKPGLSGRTMLVIDVPSRKVVGKVDFGHEVRPHQPVLDPASGLLYVTTELDESVTVIDPRTLKIVGAVPTGQEESHMLVLSHDGRLGYTANVGPGTVSVLDMAERKTVAVIPVSRTVQRISISNDDMLVFTSDQAKPRLAVIDTGTKTVKGWVELPGLGYGTASTRDGRWLLVAVPGAKVVAVVDLSSMKVARTIAVPAMPQEILVRPDGLVAYVSCNTSGKVAAIDLLGEMAQWKVESLIATGKLADGLGWAR
ncbi:DNA-binding beta-propeller fold protein YncE [Granulicella arctica]|uniref:DNA-binding beta-propeller fold protein YncE n=1 Tax=Granulicella arctica TaxID=940613 RepID=A0A7Y9TK05_9BACT|nr:DNA-binding beta-propeller fold protein YncE [Granulicella arctica]